MSISFDDDGGRLQKQGLNQREPSWDANIKWFQFPDGDPNVYYYRLVARPTFYATHWIPTRKADGTEGKAYPVLCCDYDSKTNAYATEKKCVICDFMRQVYDSAPTEKDKEGKNRKILPDRIKRMSSRLTMAHNAIIREIQNQGAPQNNTGGWTFIHPIRLPQGASNLLAEKEERFGHKYQEQDGNGKFFTRIAGFAHALYGKDIAISYNSKFDAQKMYQIDVGPRDPVTPLTEEEKSHKHHLIDFAAAMKYPSPETLQRSLEKNGLYDYLNQLTAMSNLKTVTRSVAPAAPAKTNQIDPSFDDHGGLAVHQLGESRWATSNLAAEDDVPSFTSDVKEWERQQTEKKAQATSTAPITIASAPIPTPVPQEAPAPSTPVVTPPVALAPAKGTDINSKLEAFSQSSGVKLVVDNSTYEKVRLFKTGMSVPECFKTYLVTSKSSGICKGCPLRMDCMMVSPAQIPTSSSATQPTQQG